MNGHKYTLIRARDHLLQDFSELSGFYVWHDDYKRNTNNNCPYKFDEVIVIEPAPPYFPVVYYPFVYDGWPIVLCK